MAIKAQEYAKRLSQVKPTTSSASCAAQAAFNRYYGVQSSWASKQSQSPFRSSPPPSFTTSCPSSASSPSSPCSSIFQSPVSFITSELKQACYDLGAKIDADRNAEVGRRTLYRGQPGESEDHEPTKPPSSGLSLVFVRDLAADGAACGPCHLIPAVDLGDSYLPLPDPDRVLKSWRHRTCRNRRPSMWRKIIEKVKNQVRKLKVWNRYEGMFYVNTL